MKKVSARTLGISVSIVFTGVMAIVVIGSYARYETSATAQKIASVLHLPVFISGNPFFVFTATELRGDMQSIRKFYEGQDFSSVGMRVDFSTENGRKQLLVRERGVMNKTIEDRVIAKIVEDAGIRVTDEEVKQNVDRRLREFGADEGKMAENLERLYGWNMNDFEEKVVKAELYKQKAKKIFEERDKKTKDEESQKKIHEAKNALDSGRSFAEVTQAFSEGVTASKGGDLGWIELSGAEPNLADAISKMKTGARSDIIETSVGYHIVEVQGIRDDAGTKLYHVYQIIARKETFADWVNAYIKKLPLWVMLPDYRWNSDTGYVEFTNPVMTEFEAKNLGEEKVVPLPDSENKQ